MWNLVIVHQDGAVASHVLPETEARDAFDRATECATVVYAHYSAREGGAAPVRWNWYTRETP